LPDTPSCDYRVALLANGISPCIPPRKERLLPANFDKNLYRQRHAIEIMFGRLKDWLRIHTRCDRCARTFMSAIAIDAIIIFWIS
jgi:transposase